MKDEASALSVLFIFRLNCTPKCLLEVTYRTVHMLKAKFLFFQDEYIQAFIILLSLMLKVLSIYLKYSSQESEGLIKKDTMLTFLNSCVKEWIKKVIGGDMFGCAVKHSWLSAVTELEKSTEELKVIEHRCTTLMMDLF